MKPANNFNNISFCHEREIADLAFFFKVLYDNTNLDVKSFVFFTNNGLARLCQNPSLALRSAFCKCKKFQAWSIKLDMDQTRMRVHKSLKVTRTWLALLNAFPSLLRRPLYGF